MITRLPSRSATRIGLQRAALADLQPGWVPELSGLDATLVEKARLSVVGRMFLSRQLVASGSVLFAGLLLSGDEAEALQQDAWLLTPLANADELFFDLGAQALAAGLRAIVARDDVLRVRRVLGESRYRELLARQTPVQSATSLSLDSDESLADSLRKRGAHEIERYAATHLPPALFERVRLAFDRSWIDDALPALLPMEAVRTRLMAHRRNAIASGLAAGSAVTGAAA